MKTRQERRDAVFAACDREDFDKAEVIADAAPSQVQRDELCQLVKNRRSDAALAASADQNGARCPR